MSTVDPSVGTNATQISDSIAEFVQDVSKYISFINVVSGSITSLSPTTDVAETKITELLGTLLSYSNKLTQFSDRYTAVGDINDADAIPIFASIKTDYNDEALALDEILINISTHFDLYPQPIIKLTAGISLKNNPKASQVLINSPSVNPVTDAITSNMPKSMQEYLDAVYKNDFAVLLNSTIEMLTTQYKQINDIFDEAMVVDTTNYSSDNSYVTADMTVYSRLRTYALDLEGME